MNDLERDLHELLDAKARDASPPAPADVHVLRRARRRQVGTVATALVVLAAIVVGSVIALDAYRAVDEAPPRPASTPVLPDAPPGFESAALPYASIAYPEDWYLLDTSPLVPLGVAEPELLSGPVLQLANFDPDLPHAPRCMVDPDALPPQGVLLTVGIMTPEEAAIAGEPSGPWPVKLAPLPSSSDPVCTGGPRPYVATWTTQSGVIYWANAAQGSDAADADVEAMERAFASLAFPSTTEPQMSRMAAFQGQGTPRVVLGTERIGNGIATLVAYVEFNKSLLVGVSGSRGGDCCIGSAIAPHSGSSQQPVTTTILLSPQGTLVYGAITAEVAEAELRTSNGDAVPVRIAALPPSMGFEDRVAWGVAPGLDDRATMVGFDAEGNLIGNPILPAGPRVTIATGDDPEGGPWELYLEPTSDGTGLGFEFTNHGGGSGCCLRPLKSDFQLDGWGSGGDAPSNITVLASDVVAQVAFEAADGTTVDGALYPVPDDAVEIPQVGLVIVPKDVPPEGEVVGYDADGNEVGREFVGETGEPAGPTPEIDVVWTRLRRARDTATSYAARHGGSLDGFDASEAARIDPGIGGDPGIRWNDGPIQEGEVTIRGVARAGGSELTGWSGWNVVLVSATAGPDGAVGSIYCIAVNIDGGGGGNFRYGTQDAPTYEECRGGWPELE
jgi:hypothetical protein